MDERVETARLRALFEKLCGRRGSRMVGTAPELGTLPHPESPGTQQALCGARQAGLELAELCARAAQLEQLAEQLAQEKVAATARLGQELAQLGALRRQLRSAESALAAHTDAVELIAQRRQRNARSVSALRQLLQLQEELSGRLRSVAGNAQIEGFYEEQRRELGAAVDGQPFWAAGPVAPETLRAQQAYLAELRAALGG